MRYCGEAQKESITNLSNAKASLDENFEVITSNSMYLNSNLATKLKNIRK